MIAVKDTPVGVDVWIQRMQEAMYQFLLSAYSMDESDYNCYGRVYRNFGSGNKEYLPQAYTGNRNYVDVLFQDTVKLQTFFDISETIKIGEDFSQSAKVILYCFADVERLYTGNVDRMDWGILETISNFLNGIFGFQISAKHVGIKKVLSDFSGYRKESAVTTAMQPYYACAIEMSLPHYYVCDGYQYRQPELTQIPFVVNNPIGIDYWIKMFQVSLFNYILTRYSLQATDYNCYGRVYRNGKSSSDGREYLPQAYRGVREYVDVLFEDPVVLQSFFEVGETVDSVGMMSMANVSLFFFANLEGLYPTADDRPDMDFLNTVFSFCAKNAPGFLPNKIQVGIKKILDQFQGCRIKKAKEYNMQPYYAFRIDFKKMYDPSASYCPSLVPDRVYEFAPDEFASDDFA